MHAHERAALRVLAVTAGAVSCVAPLDSQAWWAFWAVVAGLGIVLWGLGRGTRPLHLATAMATVCLLGLALAGRLPSPGGCATSEQIPLAGGAVAFTCSAAAKSQTVSAGDVAAGSDRGWWVMTGPDGTPYTGVYTASWSVSATGGMRVVEQLSDPGVGTIVRTASRSPAGGGWTVEIRAAGAFAFLNPAFSGGGAAASYPA